MVENVINAFMAFFDGTLVGNIINRFSNDLAVIDETFPFDVYEFFEVSRSAKVRHLLELVTFFRFF